MVYDRAAYEAHRAAHPAASEDEARAATAIEGATVHLQRFTGGNWPDVNASDPGIDPNVNPQVTGANGLYKWDVADGTYRVRVDAPGFRSKTSAPVVIPPPVLDLHVGLDRNPAPEAAIDAAGEAFRGQTVTFDLRLERTTAQHRGAALGPRRRRRLRRRRRAPSASRVVHRRWAGRPCACR